MDLLRDMRDPSLRAAMTALARAFPGYLCKGERSSPGMNRVLLYLESDGSHQLGWTTTDLELRRSDSRERLIYQMQAALGDHLGWPDP